MTTPIMHLTEWLLLVVFSVLWGGVFLPDPI
jgi:hypothetical protein